MVSSYEIKLVKSLQQKKFREEHSLFVVEGEKNVEELLKSNFSIKNVFHTNEWQRYEHLPYFELVSNDELSRMSGLKTANKVLALVEIPKENHTQTFESPLYLAIDGIQDPGNFGTIIRIADWYGITDIFCSEKTVEVFNPKVIQASMGSAFSVKCHYSNICKTLKSLRINEYEIIGTHLLGIDIADTKMTSKNVLVIGNESKGICEEVEQICTQLVKIPRYSKNIDSLNVAIATGICLYALKNCTF